jgi:hypothetical protein
VIIAGERIEYMERNGNTLARLRRSTLGTGGKDYPIDTLVIDQGLSHTIPYKEFKIKQIFTATNTTTYVMTDIRLNTSVTASDQVEVRYGGRLLRKPVVTGTSLIVHNPAISYDTVLSPEFNIIRSGTTGTLILSLLESITSGTQISVVQHIAPKGIDWYLDDGSLLDDSSQVARFLRERPAPLPDKYQYGQF